MCLLIGGTVADAGPMLSGGITVVGLFPEDERILNDLTMSADLYVEQAIGSGNLNVYIEANSRLDADQASSMLVESNADAGTALIRGGKGGVQLSELYYRKRMEGEAALSFGMLDPSSYLDRTRITNDENVQFLGASFVNNPTIAFPDYTLGVVYQRPGHERLPQINAVLASANGLADNPNLSYSELLRLTADDDGVFAAIGLGWENTDRLVRAGAWLNSRAHVLLEDPTRTAGSYGAYLVFGQSLTARHALNLRVGFADDDVTAGSRFVSVAWRARWRDHALGIAVARTFLSDKVVGNNLDDTTHLEMYGRFALNGRAHVTGSVQHIINSGFQADASGPRSSAWLAGLRFHYAF